MLVVEVVDGVITPEEDRETCLQGLLDYNLLLDFTWTLESMVFLRSNRVDWRRIFFAHSSIKFWSTQFLLYVWILLGRTHPSLYWVEDRGLALRRFDLSFCLLPTWVFLVLNQNLGWPILAITGCKTGVGPEVTRLSSYYTPILFLLIVRGWNLPRADRS